MDIGEIRQKVDDLVTRLGELVELIQDLFDSPESAAKREQLHAICKTIKSLERSGVPVPDDFRRIKTDLTSQVATVEQADELRKHLAEKLTDALRGLGCQPARGNGGRRDRGVGEGRTRGVSLGDLMQADLLKEGTKLVHRGKKGRHAGMFVGVVRSPGQIEVEVDGKKKLFNNPSAAATAFIGGTCNGWDWWSVMGDDGRDTRLNALRTKVSD